jgi:thiamine biosynthesis lipoprotein
VTSSLFALCLAALALQAPLPTADGPPPQSLRFSARAFGGRAAVEVRGLEPAAAESAARAALETIREFEALSDPQGLLPGGVGALNRAAGGQPVALQPRVLAMLARALTFCDWSSGAHGPLGGRLYELWGLRSPAPGLPPAPRREEARASAACGHLRLDAARGTATVDAGTRVDPWGFAAGFAVDEAISALRASGVRDGWAAAGGAQRAFGGGPSGRGWPATLPALAGSVHPADAVLLVDQALAYADGTSGRMRAGGEEHPPYIDQRSGRPPAGMLLTAASTELAVDAQALAVSAFLLGNREAQFRAGNLRPKPALYWAVGSGGGEPMVLSYGWSALRRDRGSN